MPNTQAPRILVCGWAGAGNIGDELLTRELVRRLRAAGAVAVIASRNPTETRAAHPDAEAVPWGPRGVRAIAGIDGVCVGPGGILQDSSSMWNLPGHLILPWVAKRRGAVVRSLGVGAESLNRPSSGRMLRAVLEQSVVLTRDDASTVALAAAGLNARTGADVVFGLELPLAEARNEIVVSVGPAVRSGRIVPAARRLMPLEPGPIATALDRLADRCGASVVFTAFRGERDRVAADEIAAQMSTAATVMPQDVEGYVDRVVGARLVISSRYHPVVLAAASGTPALVISTQEKVRSLVAMIANPLVTMVASWQTVGASVLAERGDPAIPGGLPATHAAISELAQEAAAVRTNRSLG